MYTPIAPSIFANKVLLLLASLMLYIMYHCQLFEEPHDIIVSRHALLHIKVLLLWQNTSSALDDERQIAIRNDFFQNINNYNRLGSRYICSVLCEYCLFFPSVTNITCFD